MPQPPPKEEKANEKTPKPSHQGGYVNALFNIAWLGFDDIKRRFSVGPVAQEAKSETSGMDYYTLFYGAYYIPSSDPRISTGPLASLEYQYVTVNGYTEYNLVYGNLVFKDQSNHSLSSGLGWEARFEYPSFSGDVSLSINRQWLGTLRHVYFREKSLPANYGIWPAEMPQTTFVSGNIDFSIFCGKSVLLSVGYLFNCGISEIPMREQFLSLNISL